MTISALPVSMTRTTNAPSQRAGRDATTPTARGHGPLRPLLVALTVVTGLVDAFSYLSLGHVFVANMTGNVVFLGFGLAGIGDIAINASLVAILAFALGAFLGDRWAMHRGMHRGHLLAAAAATQAALVIAAAILAGASGVGASGAGASGARLWLVGLLAVAMGGQNAVARRLAVPDLTTTVLTLTVTGLVADVSSWSGRRRRLVPVVAMLAGALAGGVLLRLVNTVAPLWLAAAILAASSVMAYAAARRPDSDGWGERPMLG